MLVVTPIVPLLRGGVHSTVPPDRARRAFGVPQSLSLVLWPASISGIVVVPVSNLSNSCSRALGGISPPMALVGIPWPHPLKPLISLPSLVHRSVTWSRAASLDLMAFARSNEPPRLSEPELVVESVESALRTVGKSSSILIE